MYTQYTHDTSYIPTPYSHTCTKHTCYRATAGHRSTSTSPCAPAATAAPCHCCGNWGKGIHPPVLFCFLGYASIDA